MLKKKNKEGDFMSRCIRIVEDTQLAINVPIRVMGARLVHTGATTAGVYDQAGATAGSPDVTKKRIALATQFTTTVVENLVDEATLPIDGLLFTEGCYIEWTAGEVFLYIKE